MSSTKDILTAKDLIDNVVNGASPDDVILEASQGAVGATVGHNQQFAMVHTYAPSSGIQVATGEEDDAEHYEDLDDEDPRTRNYPLAQTRKWPRGSHESMPAQGEAPHFKESDGSKSTVNSMIESAAEGILPRDVFKHFVDEMNKVNKDSNKSNLSEDE